MERDRYLEHLRRDGDAIAVALEAAPTALVPTCPGWTVADLAGHMGTIHRWAGEMVRTRSQERISRRDLPPPPDDPALLASWFRAGLDDLLGVLATADPTAGVWTFGADRTVAFWVRRMAQETAVHRWDAESASGSPRPVDPDVAADGVDEMLDVFVAGQGTDRSATGRLDLRATDVPRQWSLPFGDPGASAVATGTASDLLLFLWGRVGPGTLTTTGTVELLARWQEDVRI